MSPTSDPRYRVQMEYEIAKARLAGKGVKKTAAEFNARGVKTLTGTGNWTPTTVARILREPRTQRLLLHEAIRANESASQAARARQQAFIDQILHTAPQIVDYPILIDSDTPVSADQIRKLALEGKAHELSADEWMEHIDARIGGTDDE